MMKKQFWLMSVFCFILLVSTVQGALNSYLRLEGESQGDIRGDVTQLGRENTILIYGFNHSVVSPRDAATGLPTGKRQHQPLRITKRIDKATPKLMRALCDGEKMTHFRLDFFRIHQSGTEELYYSIRLTDAQIVSVQQTKPFTLLDENADLADMEYVTFTYREIAWEFPPEAELYVTPWEYDGSADLLLSDLTGDGLVNLMDLAIMAEEWMSTNK